ncbi:MAG: galactokinase [Candidatus Hydrogenedentes bacterium]|nr:galactokinase [Candidatus Hydrogenedentota bacterium]
MSTTLIAPEKISTLLKSMRTPSVVGVCRAPGRVNLIGEHTDYNGFSVLPITIKKEIHALFFSRNDHIISLSNDNPQFSPVSFINSEHIAPSATGAWENYVKSAVVAINKKFNVKDYPGFHIHISSDLPIASGLSSSSALVITSALAYLKILGIELNKKISRPELSELMAEAEHFVGTRGGGMDQTVILNGGENYACKIDFFPIKTQLIPLFEDFIFVVCDSTIRAPKTGSCLSKYNSGPIMCSIATAIFERYLQEKIDKSIKIQRLSDLWSGDLCLTLKEILELNNTIFTKETLTSREIANLLNISPTHLREKWLKEIEEPPNGFPLKAKVRHVITEHSRVELCRDALIANNPYTFGQLMNESHKSCAKDYEISTPELEMLTKIARKAGAIGSRLTGAGFGGCTINLIPKENVEKFMEEVEKEYYRKYLGLSSAKGMFIAETADPADYIKLEHIKT